MHRRRVGNGPRTFEELACCFREHEPLCKASNWYCFSLKTRAGENRSEAGAGQALRSRQMPRATATVSTADRGCRSAWPNVELLAASSSVITHAARGLAKTATIVNTATAMVRRGVTSASPRFYPEVDGASAHQDADACMSDIASRVHRSFGPAALAPRADAKRAAQTSAGCSA